MLRKYFVALSWLHPPLKSSKSKVVHSHEITYRILNQLLENASTLGVVLQNLADASGQVYLLPESYLSLNYPVIHQNLFEDLELGFQAWR